MSDQNLQNSEPGRSDTSGVDASQDINSIKAAQRRAIVILGIIATLIITVFVVAYSPKGKPSSGMLPMDPSGYMAPNIELPSLNTSGELKLSNYLGSPVVLNFWASWCTTCKEEAELLGISERKWRDKGIVFLGVDSSDKRDSALAFATRYKFEYDSFFDATGAIAPQWGVTGYPETFFIDANGRIVSKFISAIDEKTLDDRIAELLK